MLVTMKTSPRRRETIRREKLAGGEAGGGERVEKALAEIFAKRGPTGNWTMNSPRRFAYTVFRCSAYFKKVDPARVYPLRIFHSVSPATRCSEQGNGQRRSRRTGRIRGGRCGPRKALRDARALRTASERRCDRRTVGPDSETDQAFGFPGGDASGRTRFSLVASQ